MKMALWVVGFGALAWLYKQAQKQQPVVAKLPAVLPDNVIRFPLRRA